MLVNEKFFVFKEEIKHKDENILNCIEYLNQAGDSDTVSIEFIDNAGGSVVDIHALIEAIESTEAQKVILIFKNYAISAVAYMLCYFQINYVSDKIVIETSPNLCCVYHRPRIEDETGIYFANTIKPQTKDSAQIYLLVMSYCFDVVFYKLVEKIFPTNKNYSEMAEKMYTSNGDFAFIL